MTGARAGEVLRARLQRDRCLQLSAQLEAELLGDAGGGRSSTKGSNGHRKSAEVAARERVAAAHKTFLQSLHPTERRAILAKAHSAPTPASDRDITEAAEATLADDTDDAWSADADRDEAPTWNSKLATRPPALSKSADDTEEEIWGAARLRVKAASLAAENDALRKHNRAIAHAACEAQAAASAAVVAAEAQHRRTTEDAASRVVSLEEQLARHKSALSELSQSAEQLAKDNVALAEEAVQCRTDSSAATKKVRALEGRVAQLQELYLSGLREGQAERGTAARKHDKLWDELVTEEVLAASRPPVDFPIPEACEVPTHVRPLMNEVASLRKERETLQSQLKASATKCSSLESENEELRASSHRDRLKLRQLSASAQTKLIGAMRRIKYLVEEGKKNTQRMRTKDEYISRLEAQLLAQHKALQQQASGAKAVGKTEARALPQPLPREPPSSGAEAGTVSSPLSDNNKPRRGSCSPSRTRSCKEGEEKNGASRKRRHISKPAVTNPAVQPQDVAGTGEGCCPPSGAGPRLPSAASASIRGTPLAHLPQELREKLGPVESSWRMFSASESSGASSEADAITVADPQESDPSPNALCGGEGEDGWCGVGTNDDEPSDVDHVEALTRQLKALHACAGQTTSDGDGMPRGS